MRIHLNAIIPIEFEEHPVRDFKKGIVSLLDVTTEGQTFSMDVFSPSDFSNLHYCYCLFSKILELPSDKLDQFLSYQLLQMKDELKWLRQFEAFVEVNAGLLSIYTSEAVYKQLKEHIRKNKYLPLPDTLSYLSTSMKTHYEQKYNLDKVRLRLKDFNNFSEQLEYLMNLKIDFIQNPPSFSIVGVEPFDKLLDLEIKKVKTLQKQSKYIPQVPSDILPESKKCTTTLTVAQLAYKYRLLYDLDLLPVRTKTMLFKIIAQTFSTSNQKNISWRSFKNNFDNPDPKAIDFWVSKFQHLAKLAKKDKEN